MNTTVITGLILHTFILNLLGALLTSRLSFYPFNFSKRILLCLIIRGTRRLETTGTTCLLGDLLLLKPDSKILLENRHLLKAQFCLHVVRVLVNPWHNLT